LARYEKARLFSDFYGKYEVEVLASPLGEGLFFEAKAS